MKLYTEEDVLHMLRSFHNIEINVQLCMLKLTPIELPSDKEIHDECKIGGMDTNQQLCFQLGAKWIRNKIQGGNK